MTANDPNETDLSGGEQLVRTMADVTDGMRQTAYTVATMSGALWLGVLTLGFTPLSNLTGAQSLIGWGACILMSLLFIASTVIGLAAASRRKVKVGSGNGFDWQAKLVIFGLVATVLVVAFAVMGTRKIANQQTDDVAKLETELVSANSRITALEGDLTRVRTELNSTRSDLVRAQVELDRLRREAAEPVQPATDP